MKQQHLGTMKRITIIAPPTEDEIKEYEIQKEKEKEIALSDKEKQTYKLAKGICAVGKLRVGLCPTCDHCLIWGDTECDECFQKVKWY